MTLNFEYQLKNLTTLDDPDGVLVRLLARSKVVGGCLEWQGKRGLRGYGHITVLKQQAGGNRLASTHRAMWIALMGKIPDGLCVLHACDNPPCINPDHLFLGTHKDNAIDRSKKGRSSRLRGEDSGTAKLSNAQRAAALSEYLGGVWGGVVAAKYGVSAASIRKYAREAGVRVGRSGSRNAKAKLTPALIARIYDMKHAGISNVKIGAALGVTDVTVGNLLRGRTWKKN